MKNTEQTIFRTEHNEYNPYSIVNMEYAYNLDNLAQIGLLTLLLGNADNFKIHKVDILNHLNIKGKQGRTSFRKIWKELEDKGHIVKKGDGTKTIYYIYEAPVKNINNEEVEEESEIDKLKKELALVKSKLEKQSCSHSKDVLEDSDIIISKEDITPIQDDLDEFKEQDIKYKIEQSFIIDNVYPKEEVIKKIKNIIKYIGIKNKSEIPMLKEVFKINYDSKSDTILIINKLKIK